MKKHINEEGSDSEFGIIELSDSSSEEIIFDNELIDARQNLVLLSFCATSYELVKTSLPFVASSLINMSGVIGCNYFLSRLGGNQLAASSLMLSVQSLITTGGSGMLFATAVHMGDALGSHQHNHVANIFQNAIFISFVLALIGATIACLSKPILLSFNQKVELVEIAQKYLYFYAGALPATFITVAETQAALGLNHSRVVFLSYLAASLLLLALAYPSILGVGKTIPAYGASGYGFSLLLSSWLVLAGLSAYLRVSDSFKPYHLFQRLSHYDFSISKRLLKDGCYISAQLSLEQISLMVMTLLVGQQKTVELQAFQIVDQFFFPLQAINFASAHAAGVLVSIHEGRTASSSARRFGHISIVGNLLLACCAAIVFFTLHQPLTRIFLNNGTSENEQVAEASRTIFMFRAAELVLASVAYASAGALRGYTDTRTAMLASLLSTGLTTILGYVLARTEGIPGLFSARLIGVSLSSLLLAHRWLTKSNFMVATAHAEDGIELQQVNSDDKNDGERNDEFSESTENDDDTKIDLHGLHRNNLLNEQSRRLASQNTSHYSAGRAKDYHQFSCIGKFKI